MMGSTGDPDVSQGPAVAATVFSAVIVYIVRFLLTVRTPHNPLFRDGRLGTGDIRLVGGYDANEARAGFPRSLRFPGLPTHAREPTGSDYSVVTINRTSRKIQAVITSINVLPVRVPETVMAARG